MGNTSIAQLLSTLSKASLAELVIGCKQKVGGIKSASCSVRILSGNILNCWKMRGYRFPPYSAVQFLGVITGGG